MFKWLHQYPLALPLIAMVIGIICYQLVDTINYPIVISILVIQIIVSILLHRMKFITTVAHTIRLFILMSFFVFIGILLTALTDVRNEKQYFGNHIDSFQYFIGTVTEEPIVKDKITIYNVAVNSILINNKWYKSSGNAIVNLYNSEENPDIILGDNILLPNKLDKIKHSGNPYSFDFAAFQNNKGLYYQQFSGYNDIKVHNNNNEAVSSIISNKKKIQNIIAKNVSDTMTSSLLQAILINERQSLDKNLWQTYSKTGIVHIISISGMHISIFFFAVYYLLYWIRNKKYEWIKYLIALPLIWIYVAMTGFPPSAVRAGTMISILSIGIFLSKKNNPINTLLATALILLLIFPRWLYDLGFQLSFVSVLSILVFYPTVYSWYRAPNKLINFFWSTIAVSIAVQPLIFPVILYYFHQFPIFGIIANIPATLYSFVFMLGGILLILVGSVGVEMTWLGDILSMITHWFNLLMDSIAAISPDFFYSISIDIIALWLIMLLIVLTSIYFYTWKKQWIITSIISLLTLGIYQSIQIFNTLNQERLVVYNVYGKSMASYILSRKSTIIKDEKVLDKDELLFLKPAHIGYRIKKVDSINKKNPIFIINKNKIIYMQQPILEVNNNTYPIHTLIVNHAASKSLENLINTFQPKQIVFDGTIRNYQIDNLELLTENRNIATHFVVRDGAFVMAQ